MTGDTHVVPCGDPEHCAAGGECIDYADELAVPTGPGPRPEALAAVTEAVRLVEDAIDATSDGVSVEVCAVERIDRVMVPSARTGLAVVEALVEAGWAPPTEAAPDPARPLCTCGCSACRGHVEPDPDVRAYDAAKAADTGVRVPLADLVAEALVDEPGP